VVIPRVTCRLTAPAVRYVSLRADVGRIERIRGLRMMKGSESTTASVVVAWKYKLLTFKMKLNQDSQKRGDPTER
jgi:hypothetical protein